jgi:tetratricopeptide (TPR) repeat protein
VHSAVGLQVNGHEVSAMLQHVISGVVIAITMMGAPTSALADDWADCSQRARPDLIIRACTHIIELAEASGEKLAEAYNHRGVGYYLRGEYHRAIADYNSAIELRPDYAIAHYNRGAAHVGEGEPDRAINEFRMVTRLLPANDPWSRLALARLEEIASPEPTNLSAHEEKTEVYRVDNVAAHNVLNMRSGPGTDFPVVAEIPPNGSGVSVRTCKVVEGYRAKWCEASWQNHSGWISACCLVSEVTGLPPD